MIKIIGWIALGKARIYKLLQQAFAKGTRCIIEQRLYKSKVITLKKVVFFGEQVFVVCVVHQM